MFKSPIFLSFLPLFLISCDVKDDPELVKQLDDTKSKVQATEAELAKVEAEIKAIRTTDPSEELTKLKVEIEKAGSQKTELEREIQELSESQKSAAEDLATYKEKYLLR